MTEFFPDAFSQMVRTRKHGSSPVKSTDDYEVPNHSRMQIGLHEPELARYPEPVAITVATGLGAKITLAAITGILDTIGIDAVAMSTNSIVCSGADPQFFTHHITIAADHDKPDETVSQILRGIKIGCSKANVAMIGMNVYETSDQIAKNGVLLTAHCTGFTDAENVGTESPIQDGDILIGLASSGIHCSGLQFLMEHLDMSYNGLSRYVPELSKTLGEELLTPTSIYSRSISYLRSLHQYHVHDITHIGSGGLSNCIAGIMPEGIRATVFAHNFPLPEIFNIISTECKLTADEMYHRFNMGIGLVMALPKNEAGSMVNALVQCGERPYVIGYCQTGEKGVDIKW